VLVVDDDKALLTLAIRTLEEVGYAPVGFASSTAALEAFRADPGQFDAIVTDERMPGFPDRRLSGKCAGSEAQSRSFWSAATSAAR